MNVSCSVSFQVIAHGCMRSSSTAQNSGGVTNKCSMPYLTCARSLDSYRAGNRFGNERRRRPARPHVKKSGPTPQFHAPEEKEKDGEENDRVGGKVAPASKRVKSHIPLIKALTLKNISSLETCDLMIRNGCVLVNGVKVRDSRAKVDRFEDVLTVNRLQVGTVEPLEPCASDEDDADDFDVLPRTQRDFRQSSYHQEPRTRKYSRRIDGGFLSSRGQYKRR